MSRAGLTGGCQCGAVRYALATKPTRPSICHCRMCQKAFGNYFAPLTGVKRADLVWTRGEPAHFRSSEAVQRGFCRDCGTPLTYDYLSEDRICVSIGSLDDPSQELPEIQFGTESRVPAFAILHTLPDRPSNLDADPVEVARMRSRQHPDHD